MEKKDLWKSDKSSDKRRTVRRRIRIWRKKTMGALRTTWHEEEEEGHVHTYTAVGKS